MQFITIKNRVFMALTYVRIKPSFYFHFSKLVMGFLFKTDLKYKNYFLVCYVPYTLARVFLITDI